MVEEAKPRYSQKEYFLGVTALLATVAICIAALIYQDDIMKLANVTGYGLLGVFVIALIAGSTVSVTAIPIPYGILVFTMSSLLAARWGLWAPALVATASAIGATVGHIPTFLLGYSGRGFYARFTAGMNNRFYEKMIEWAKKHGAWVVFFMSAVLNPMHLPMTVAIGALRYHPVKFLFFSFLGNMVKGLSIAFAGYFGLQTLSRFLGIN